MQSTGENHPTRRSRRSELAARTDRRGAGNAGSSSDEDDEDDADPPCCDEGRKYGDFDKIAKTETLHAGDRWCPIEAGQVVPDCSLDLLVRPPHA